MQTAFAARPEFRRSSCLRIRLPAVLAAALASSGSSAASGPVLFESNTSVDTSLLVQHRYDAPAIHELAMRLAPASYGAISTVDLVLGMTALPTEPPRPWVSGSTVVAPSLRAVVTLYEPSDAHAPAPGAEIWQSDEFEVAARVPASTHSVVTIPFTNASQIVALDPNEYVYLSVRLSAVQSGLFPITDGDEGVQASFVGYAGPARSSSASVGQMTMDWFVRFAPGSNWLRQASGNSFGARLTSLVPGDSNADHAIDIDDLTSLASNWQASGATWATADFTGDGLVDIADLGIIASNWQSDTSFSESLMSVRFSNVPELQSVTLLLAAAAIRCALPRSRRRHSNCPTIPEVTFQRAGSARRGSSRR